jgi:hypothetical protein
MQKSQKLSNNRGKKEKPKTKPENNKSPKKLNNTKFNIKLLKQLKLKPEELLN